MKEGSRRNLERMSLDRVSVHSTRSLSRPRLPNEPIQSLSLLALKQDPQISLRDTVEDSMLADPKPKQTEQQNSNTGIFSKFSSLFSQSKRKENTSATNLMASNTTRRASTVVNDESIHGMLDQIKRFSSTYSRVFHQ
jgi:hypothetical protein